MSRIGKGPIPIPKEVNVKLEGDLITVKGPKGELQRKIHPRVDIEMDDGQIQVSVKDTSKESRSLHGLFRVLVMNMVTGVSKGFERDLQIVGVGYRAEMNGNTLVLNIGYSHPINFELPKGIETQIEKTKIKLMGFDKELLGLTAAKIRGFRKPEPYKGKGIRYADEKVRRKAGKAGAAA